jgi:predicted aldo/keto reductase-like oxidoreductase
MPEQNEHCPGNRSRVSGKRRVHGFTRRDFLRSAALAAFGGRIPVGPLFAREGEAEQKTYRLRKGDMIYRRLGRTELMISEISLGGSPPPSEPVFRKAIDMGVNYVDTSSSYSNGNSERLIGRVIKGRRDTFHVATKFHFYGGWRDTRDALIREAEGSLKRLQTDYLDILLIHNLSDARVAEHEEVLAAFEKLKKAGKIRYTGVSCHRDPVEVLTPVVGSDRYDMVTVAYNSYSGREWEEGRGTDGSPKADGIEKVLALAREKDVGVVAMKTMAGGQRQDLAALLAEGVSLPRAKLKWVLRNDAVSAVITEMDTFDILMENLSASGKTLTIEENKTLARYVGATGQDLCRLCGRCSRGCPSGIPVPDILRCLQYYRDHGKRGLGRSTYLAIPEPVTIRGCTRCGQCERSCPFGVRIVPLLRQADRILSRNAGGGRWDS